MRHFILLVYGTVTYSPNGSAGGYMPICIISAESSEEATKIVHEFFPNTIVRNISCCPDPYQPSDYLFLLEAPLVKSADDKRSIHELSYYTS